MSSSNDPCGFTRYIEIRDFLGGNLPKRADFFFISITAYLSYGASFDTTLAVVLKIYSSNLKCSYFENEVSRKQKIM